MAKVDISKYSEVLTEFMKNAERFKVTKADMVNNLSQLKEAIAVFERLSELQSNLDPNSPRAKNYHNLMQSIASINNGWQYNKAQIQRESQLADASNAKDRLTSSEVALLTRLMGSSSLKNFVQFFDTENGGALQNLKSVVQLIDGPGIRRSEDSSDFAMSRRWSELYESLFNSSDISSRENSSADISRDEEEDSHASGFSLNLNQVEEARQAESRQTQAVSDIKSTSDAIQQAIVNKPKRSEVKVTSKQPKPKKVVGDSFMEDLKTFLKWTIGAGAAIAGIAWVADDIVKYLKDLIEEAKATRDSVQKFIDDRNSSKGTDREVWADPEKAAELYTGNLNAMKKKLPGFLKDVQITPDKITTLHALYGENRDSWRDRGAQIVQSVIGKSPSAFEMGIISAILSGSNISNPLPESGYFITRDESGMGYLYNIDSFVGDPSEQDPAAMQTRAILGAREAQSKAPFTRRFFSVGEIRQEAKELYRFAHPLYPEFLVNIIGGTEGEVRVFGEKLRRWIGGNTKHGISEQELNAMTVAEREAEQLKFADKLLREWVRTGGDVGSGILQGEQRFIAGEPVLDLFNFGEMVRSSESRKFRGLREAQNRGDAQAVAVEITKLLGRPVSAKSPMVQEALQVGDFGSTDEGKLWEFISRNDPNFSKSPMNSSQSTPPAVAPSQTTVSQTVTTTFNTDYSNQQVPGEL